MLSKINYWIYQLKPIIAAIKYSLDNDKVVKKIALDSAKKNFGEDWDYEIINGTFFDLSILESNQKICYGGLYFHVLMTSKK